MGAVGNGSLAVDSAIGIDRQKVLQITTFMAVRSMRAVLCEVLPARLGPLPSPLFSRIDYRFSKQLKRPL
jgi:hypothetical protein